MHKIFITLGISAYSYRTIYYKAMKLQLFSFKDFSFKRFSSKPLAFKPIAVLKGLQHRAVLSTVLALALSACATLSQDGGLASVNQTLQSRIGHDAKLLQNDSDQQLATARVNELLKPTLTLDNAVQIALLNNKGLQATLYEVGLSEADLIQASSLPNPKFSMLYAKNGDQFKIEQILTFNIFSLFTMPLAKEIGQKRLAQTKTLITLEVLRLVAETRKSYFNAIAADQAVDYMQQVKQAASASQDLAIKMKNAGNFNALDQARQQVFYAEVQAEYARTKNKELIAREQLIRLLGLSASKNSRHSESVFELPKRLPDLPVNIQQPLDVEQSAMQQRLDLKATQQDIESLAKNLGLTKATRFINVLEIGPARVLEGKRSEPYKNGVEISFELPIFDFSTAKVARAEYTYMQALNRAAEQAVNARSEVREAYFNYQTSYEIAKRYRDEIVPLRKTISEENMLRYNGMLLSVFELLNDAQTQVISVNGYIQALRDFWIAQTNLEMAMAGKPAVKE